MASFLNLGIGSSVSVLAPARVLRQRLGSGCRFPRDTHISTACHARSRGKSRTVLSRNGDPRRVFARPVKWQHPRVLDRLACASEVVMTRIPFPPVRTRRGRAGRRPRRVRRRRRRQRRHAARRPRRRSAPARPAPAVTKDDALAALVPPAVSADGKIVFGTDASYPPNEFTDTDGTHDHRHGRRPGHRGRAEARADAEFQNSAFSGIIPGIEGGQVRAGHVVVLDQRRARADRGHGQLLLRRHQPGGEVRQPGRHQRRRPVRQGGRRAGRHRAGRRPRRAQHPVHHRGQGRRSRCPSCRPRPTSRWR